MFHNIIDSLKSSNITQHNCGQQEIRLLGKLTRAELFSVSEARVHITSHINIVQDIYTNNYFHSESQWRGIAAAHLEF